MKIAIAYCHCGISRFVHKVKDRFSRGPERNVPGSSSVPGIEQDTVWHDLTKHYLQPVSLNFCQLVMEIVSMKKGKQSILWWPGCCLMASLLRMAWIDERAHNGLKIAV